MRRMPPPLRDLDVTVGQVVEVALPVLPPGLTRLEVIGRLRCEAALPGT
jgi:hypothetical protein